jgi:hypothetical protein
MVFKREVTYSPGTSPVKYSGISDLSKRPSGKKILLSGPATKLIKEPKVLATIVFKFQSLNACS